MHAPIPAFIECSGLIRSTFRPTLTEPPKKQRKTKEQKHSIIPGHYVSIPAASTGTLLVIDMLTNRYTPSTGSPFAIATSLLIRRTAPAPSLTWLAFPRILNRKTNDSLRSNVKGQCRMRNKNQVLFFVTSSSGAIFGKSGFELCKCF